MEELPSPCIVIDAEIVRRNLKKMANYVRGAGLNLRPHTKTHKSTFFASMQMQYGATGLTVAKPAEAQVLAESANDLLMAYPAVTHYACTELATLAKNKTIHVAIDSTFAADQLSAAAISSGTHIGILVDIDVGHHRTGVQSAADALTLAQYILRKQNLRLNGIMCFPGHISGPRATREPRLHAVNEKLGEVLSVWKNAGVPATIVSGGSTPTAYESRLVTHLTEIRPGTYIFNDMNCVHGDCATLDECAARVHATVVSTAVPGQIVLDCGTKTLTSDRCGPAPDSGHGLIVEYPSAKITKLSEEHAQVDVTSSEKIPRIGERVTVIPNHICPCINLQQVVWWKEPGEKPRPLPVSARGMVY